MVHAWNLVSAHDVVHCTGLPAFLPTFVCVCVVCVCMLWSCKSTCDVFIGSSLLISVSVCGIIMCVIVRCLDEHCKVNDACVVVLRESVSMYMPAVGVARLMPLCM